ncbi:hypothetical protein CLU79DRAFT_752875 [Phycomyces nitens]|nr:hypothetical protein CLU79DRAFT_752875 [Phycomyces nitens]
MTQTQTQTQPLIPPTRLITPRLASDGVFSNMSAKPESDSATTEETPPTYAVAMADQSPPYWQTTIMAPVLGDLILVEGLPTGHILHFFWNLIISATFQVFGFMLTYLLHTSHASKQGSRAGLGVSMIQYGFYLRSRGNIDDVLFDDTGNLVEDPAKEDAQEADIASCFLMILGWFLIIRSVADYTRAKRLERIIAADPTADSIV